MQGTRGVGAHGAGLGWGGCESWSAGACVVGEADAVCLPASHRPAPLYVAAIVYLP